MPEFPGTQRGLRSIVRGDLLGACGLGRRWKRKVIAGDFRGPTPSGPVGGSTSRRVDKRCARVMAPFLWPPRAIGNLRYMHSRARLVCERLRLQPLRMRTAPAPYVSVELFGSSPSRRSAGRVSDRLGSAPQLEVAVANMEALDSKYVPVEVADAGKACQYGAYVFSDGVLHWSLEVAFSSFFSFRRSVKVTNELQNVRADLQHLVEDVLGLEWSQEYQPSLKQVQVSGSDFECSKYTKNEQMLGTQGMLMLHAYWATSLRKETAKAHGASLFAAWLRRLVPPSRYSPDVLATLFGEAGQACEPERDGLECSHLRLQDVQELWAQGTSDEARLVATISALFKASGACQAARAALRRLVSVLAAAIDAAVAAIDVPAEKLQHREGKGRKYVMAKQAYKVHVLRKLVRGRRPKEAKALLMLEGFDPSIHNKWVKKDMLSYQCASMRNFSGGSGTFGLMEDAARLGYPARETVVFCLWSASAGESVALPPQAVLSLGTMLSASELDGRLLHLHEFCLHFCFRARRP